MHDRVVATGVAAAGALPVAVDGPAHLVTQVAAFVEGRLGWQVTDGDDLPARVRLRGVTGARGGGAVDDRRVLGPMIALVGPDDDPVAAAALARDADAVVAWPADHDRLATAVAQALDDDAARPGSRGGPTLVVAGAAGGVGTTTVALALAGLAAWEGRAVLAVLSGAVPVPDVRTVPGTALAGHRGWAAAVRVPDLPDLRVIAVDRSPAHVDAPAAAVVVVDRGVVGPTSDHAAGDDVPPDVLVVRRDRAGCEAVASTPAGTVVVVDIGVRRSRDLAAAAAGRPLVTVPWSVRVARAHDAGRVPGSLPGSVVESLRPVHDAWSDDTSA